MVICLQRGADLHMSQLMPLPLTVSSFSKILIGFTFLVPAHPGSPGKRAVKRLCEWLCSQCSVHLRYVSCSHIFMVIRTWILVFIFIHRTLFVFFSFVSCLPFPTSPVSVMTECCYRSTTWRTCWSLLWWMYCVHTIYAVIWPWVYVRHKSALFQNWWTDNADFRHRGFLQLHCV